MGDALHCAGPLLSHNIPPSPLVRVAICTVIPAPPTVIPAQAGIYVCGGTGVGRTNTPYNRHSGASRNLGRVVIYTVIPAPPTVIPAQAGIYVCGGTGVGRTNTPYNRNSGASRNLCVRGNGRRAHQYPLQPSFRRKPESMCAEERTSGAPTPPATVIPAQAGMTVNMTARPSPLPLPILGNNCRRHAFSSHSPCQSGHKVRL